MVMTKEDAYSKLVDVHPDLTFPDFHNEFNNTGSYITYICSKHGVFKSLYGNMYSRGSGCPQCGRERANRKMRKSVDIAKSDLISVHGDKYSFPHFELEFYGNNSRITAVCSFHGEFVARYGDMYNSGSGCPQCGKERSHNKQRKDIPVAKSDIESVHGDKLSFPYFESEYVNAYSNITAICPIHGVFVARYANMYNNHTGCLKCAIQYRADKKRRSAEVVRNDLQSVHGTKFSFPYVEDEYSDVYSKLTVICPIHGEFKSSFTSMYHLKSGCPRCYHDSHMNISGFPHLADYDSYHSRLTIDDNATRGSMGELQVRCKLCNNIFTPSLSQVSTRISCLRGVGGESNFYCSEECKQKCVVYNAKSDTHILARQVDNYEAKVKLARNCQHETKMILRKQQIDQYGYHFCEKCGKRVDNPDLHHTIEVAKDPSGAITIAGQMLVCYDPCHKELTAGCK